MEMMEYDDEIKNLLLQGKTALDIEAYALKNGMINLERDGIFKSIEGQTTIEEVYRIVKHKWLDKEKQNQHTIHSAQAKQQAKDQQSVEKHKLDYGAMINPDALIATPPTPETVADATTTAPDPRALAA